MGTSQGSNGEEGCLIPIKRRLLNYVDQDKFTKLGASFSLYSMNHIFKISSFKVPIHSSFPITILPQISIYSSQILPCPAQRPLKNIPQRLPIRLRHYHLAMVSSPGPRVFNVLRRFGRHGDLSDNFGENRLREDPYTVAPTVHDTERCMGLRQQEANIPSNHSVHQSQ